MITISIQAGLIEFWLIDLLAKSGLEGQKRANKEDGAGQRDSLQLNIHHLQPAFAILIGGLLLAFSVAVFEKMTSVNSRIQ